MKIISKQRSLASPGLLYYSIYLDGEEKLTGIEGVPAEHLKQIKEKLPIVLLLDPGAAHFITNVGFKTHQTILGPVELIIYIT